MVIGVQPTKPAVPRWPRCDALGPQSGCRAPSSAPAGVVVVRVSPYGFFFVFEGGQIAKNDGI